jgi:hypothetical protein
MKSQAHPARAARKKLLCLTTLTAASIAAAHGTAHRPDTSESFSAVKKMQPPLLRCVLYVKFLERHGAFQRRHALPGRTANLPNLIYL